MTATQTMTQVSATPISHHSGHRRRRKTVDAGPPALVNIDTVAKDLGVHANTAWKLVTRAGIERVMLGEKTVRFRRRDIDAWIAAGCPLEVKRKKPRTPRAVAGQMNQETAG